jgi:lysophospholipase L1-like esterase
VYTPSTVSYPINVDISKVRIVCLGDSLTSGHPFYWAETGTGDVTASYPYQLSRRLKNQYEVINSGYGSDTTDRCIARFDRDVLAYSPQYCIFQCGTND